MPHSNDIHRPPEDSGFTEHGLDRALAEAITQASFDPSATTPAEDGPATPESRNIVHWRAHPDGESGRNTRLGIDCSPTHITLVEMDESRDGPQITGILIFEIDDAHPRSSISELFNAYGAPPATPVHVSITSPRAVVRRFRLPKVSKRQREAAALWEARKLIPFSLDDNESLHGFHFEAVKDAGWAVTLAALPREDVGKELDCIQAAGWTLESVSIAGTKKGPCTAAPDEKSKREVMASLLWSPQRTSFMVFKGCELRFHYDLGIVPPPRLMPDQPLRPDDLSRWLGTLRKATGEAIEFYGGASPDTPINRIQLVGVPESAAPLITDWNEMFSASVAVSPTIESLSPDTPDHIRTWFAQNGALLVPPFLALTGTPTIDLTPTGVRQRRHSRKLEQFARGLMILSAVGITVWSGLLWTQRTLITRSHEQILRDIQGLETSPINEQMQLCVSGLQKSSSIRHTLNAAGTDWMPDVRRLLATRPRTASLISLSVIPDPVVAGVTPVMRMEGVLQPDGRAYSLTYADWLRDLRDLFGAYAVSLESVRSIEWKGTVKSSFVVLVHPGRTAPRGDKR